jgi:hypothetical protein
MQRSDGFSRPSIYRPTRGFSTSTTSLFDSNTSSDIQQKLKVQMEKLQERDRGSSPISSDVSAVIIVVLYHAYYST